MPTFPTLWSNQPAGRKKLVGSGTEVDFLGLDEFGRFMLQEMALWADLIRKANIKPRG